MLSLDADKEEEWQKEFAKHKSKYDIKPRIKERIVPKKFKKIEIIVDKMKGIFLEKDHSVIIFTCFFSPLQKSKFRLEKPQNYNEAVERFYFVDQTEDTDYDQIGFTIQLEVENKDNILYSNKLKWRDVLNEKYYTEDLTLLKFSKRNEVDKKVDLFISLQAFNFSQKK